MSPINLHSGMKMAQNIASSVPFLCRLSMPALLLRMKMSTYSGQMRRCSVLETAFVKARTLHRFVY